ncbi:MAG: hypothetical protein GY906_37235 [bacterium]|nr:hypothetical protein [bacterium]
MPRIMRIEPTINSVLLFMELSDNVWKLMLEWAHEEDDATILEDYVNEELRS